MLEEHLQIMHSITYIFCWQQIAERHKSPEELQAEYERIQRQRELQRLEERTHPKVRSCV